MKISSIKFKFVASSIIFILMLIVISGTSYYQSNKVATLNDQAMVNADLIKLIKQKEIDHLIWTDTLNESIMFDKHFDGKIDSHECAFGEWYYEFVESEEFKQLSSEQQKILLAIEEPHVELHNTASLITKEMNLKNKQAAINIYQTSTKIYLKEVRSLFNQLEEEIQKIETTLEIEVAQAKKTMEYVIFGISILSVLIAFIIVNILNKIIVKPINNTVYMLKDIAEGEGDLTNRLKVTTNDEIGELAKWFNIFIEKIHYIVRQVNEGAKAVASSSEELTATSEETTRATNQITSAIQEIAGGSESQLHGAENTAQAIKEMAKGIQHIAETSSVVSDESMKTAKEAEQGNQSIQKAVQQMNSISGLVNSTGTRVKLLGERSQEIGQIIEVITEIAEQTNLLALNAAIEAARAGEHGRGFAVVAEEVRKLADQSKKASDQIIELIQKIQDDTKRSVEAMEGVTQEVQTGKVVVNQAGEAFASILMAAQHVAEQIHEVSAISDEMSASYGEITTSFTEITHIAKKASANSQHVAVSSQEQLASMEEVAASAESLCTMALQLKELVIKFKI